MLGRLFLNLCAATLICSSLAVFWYETSADSLFYSKLQLLDYIFYISFLSTAIYFIAIAIFAPDDIRNRVSRGLVTPFFPIALLVFAIGVYVERAQQAEQVK